MHEGVRKRRGPAQPNHSLKRGLACLQSVVSSERPVGSREVARLLGEKHTQVNRLLGTLASLGLAECTPDWKVLPGPASSGPFQAVQVRDLVDRLHEAAVRIIT